MGTLTREAILGMQDLGRELVEVPEWGGAIYVRIMTGMQRDTFEGKVLRDRENGDLGGLRGVRAWLVALTACDETGNCIFQLGDIADLGEKSSVALDRIFAVALRLNKLRNEDVEELLGNLKSGRSESPGSV